MRNKYMRIHFKNFMTLLGTGIVVLTIGHGCGRMKAKRGAFDSAASLDGACLTQAGSKINPVVGEGTVSISYGSQVLDNMVACTGIMEPSVQTMEEWEARRGALSEYGYATQISAPMMMGIAAIAGEVCNDLINQEENSGTRRIFRNINFQSPPSSLSSMDVEDSISYLARSCWQREVTEEEKQDILTTIDAIALEGGDSPNDTRNSMLGLCTAMLSGLAAVQM